MLEGEKATAASDVYSFGMVRRGEAVQQYQSWEAVAALHAWQPDAIS